jgi:hypothetical protein
VAYLDGGLRECIDRMTVVVASERDVSSARLFAGLAAIALNEPSIAATHLEALLVAGPTLPDRFQAQFAAPDQVAIDVHIRLSDGIAAQAPFAEAAALLALVQLYRDEGRHHDAIALLRQVATLPPHPILQLSLADAVAASGDSQGVIDVTQGVLNTHDVAVELLRLRARAFLARRDCGEAFRAAASPPVETRSPVQSPLRRVWPGSGPGAHGRLRPGSTRPTDFEDVRERIAAPGCAATVRPADGLRPEVGDVDIPPVSRSRVTADATSGGTPRRSCLGPRSTPGWPSPKAGVERPVGSDNDAP